MTQEQLSFEADLSLRFLQEIEGGYKGASLETIFKLSNALNILPSELLEPTWKEWLQTRKKS